MQVLRHYNISPNSDVEFPTSVCGKIYERLMHVVARQPFSAMVSAKGDEIERPRVKEQVQTRWSPRKFSLHARSCIAEAFCSSSRFLCSHRPVADPASGLLQQREERPTGPWLQASKRLTRGAGSLCSHRRVAGSSPLRLSQQEERPTGPWLQRLHKQQPLQNATRKLLQAGYRAQFRCRDQARYGANTVSRLGR